MKGLSMEYGLASDMGCCITLCGLRKRVLDIAVLVMQDSIYGYGWKT